MEYKFFFSPYRIMYILGIIGSILILIIYFIISFIHCDNYSFCNLQYGSHKYLDNIFSAVSNLNIRTIMGLLLYLIFNGCYNLLIFITINKFTVCHSIILIGNVDLIYFVIASIAILVINFLYFLIIIICILVFLEYIEINCFGLSENTKRNIQKRANEDSPMLNNENQLNTTFKTDNNEDNEENDDIKNEENNNELS